MNKFAFASVGLLFGVVACGAPEGDQAPAPEEPAGSADQGGSTDGVGSVQQEVLNGSSVPTASLPGSGVVNVLIHRSDGATGHCSGVLLTNRWVLTANHCFCNGQMSPAPGVEVKMYGTEAAAADPTGAALYTAPAAQIIGHPSQDVALIRLGQTLPLMAPPKIYTGTGTELPGTSATTNGFGNYRIDSLGQEAGVGERQTTGGETIDHIGSDVLLPLLDCGNDITSVLLPATGPWTLGKLDVTLKNRVSTAGGDSGGPLFSGSASAPTLLGVTHTKTTLSSGFTYDTFEGLETVRDWIRQQLLTVPGNTACDTQLPSSTGADKGALALGPDGNLHIVAVQSDNTIGHWRISFGSIVKMGTVAGTTTSDAVGLGLESAAAPGQPLKMGLAYRDKATGSLKYARWSASTGWSAPQTAPSLVLAGGPAMTQGGPIAFIQTNGRAYVTFYDPVAATFSSARRPALTAPLADGTKRVSVGFDPAYGGITFLGYRTASGGFVQATGSAACGSGYFCTPDPEYANSWTSAMLAYAPGQRLMIVTRHTTPPFGLNVYEERVISGGTNYGWGGTQRLSIGAEPGVATIGEDTYTVGTNGSLYVSKADNCFANDF